MNFLETIISSLCSTALSLAKSIFKKVITEITTLSDPTALFDAIFPGAKTLDDVIYTIAIALGILYALVSLALTMAASDSRSAESPIGIIGRMFIFLPLTIWSKKLCELFYTIQSAFLRALGAASQANEAAGFIDILTSRLTESAAASGPSNIAGEQAFGGSGMVQATSTSADVVVLLIAVIFVFMLFIDMLKLMMQIVEQYVLIGILAHLAPLAISTGCTKKTSNIFSSWVNLFVSHLLIFILDQWSISVFTHACAYSLDMSGSVGNNGSTYGLITWIIALDAFLRLSQHWEQILNKLGLKAVGTGNGLMGSLIFAAGAARAMVRAVGGGAKAAIRASQGTYQPKPNTLADALASGAKKRAETSPGNAQRGPLDFYGKSLDKNFKAGAAAAKADIAAGKGPRAMPIPSSDLSKQYQTGYKQAFAEAGLSGAKGAAVGAAAARAGAGGKNVAGPNASATVGAVAGYRNSALSNTRPAGTRPAAHQGPPDNYPSGITAKDPTTGKTARYNSECSKDAHSIATASAFTDALSHSGAQLNSAMPGNSGEKLSIKNASYAGYDSDIKSGSMFVSADVLDKDNKVVGTMESGELAFMPDTPAAREQLDKGRYAAFDISVGSGEEKENYLAFLTGTMYATNESGDILQDKNGNDISYKLYDPDIKPEVAETPVSNTESNETANDGFDMDTSVTDDIVESAIYGTLADNAYDLEPPDPD